MGLSPRQIGQYPDRLVDLYAEVERDIIADMAKRIAEKDMFIPSAQWQFEKLQEMGMVQSDIIGRLSAATGKSKDEIRRIITESGYKALNNDAKLYKRAGIDPTESMQSQAVKQALENGLKMTNGEFENITRTTVNNATMQYFDALDSAYLQVSSGAFDYNSAIGNAIKKLTDNGIAVANYAGHNDYMETAVRRVILTGLNQTAAKSQEALADELDCDLVEVTAHSGARTGRGIANHAEWQGKIYSRSGKSKKYPSLVEKTGYGSGAGLCGWNCRHSFYPYIEGAERAYTDDELQSLNEPKYEYNGERLTEYEATQKQRYIERQIRKYKREVTGFEAAGLNTADSKSKLRRWQERQRDFIEQTGLKRDYNRENVGAVQKTVAKSEKSGIIKSVTIKDFENLKGLSNVSDECIDKICEFLGEDRKYFDSISIVEIKPHNDGSRDLLRTNIVQNGTWCDTVLEINKSVFGSLSFDDIEDIIKKSNLAGHNVGECLKDMVTHEVAHAKLVNGKNYNQVANISELLSETHYKEYAKSVSKVATVSDEECIAECYILLQKGKSIPDELRPLIEMYKEDLGL